MRECQRSTVSYQRRHGREAGVRKNVPENSRQHRSRCPEQTRVQLEHQPRPACVWLWRKSRTKSSCKSSTLWTFWGFLPKNSYCLEDRRGYKVYCSWPTGQSKKSGIRRSSHSSWHYFWSSFSQGRNWMECRQMPIREPDSQRTQTR